MARKRAIRSPVQGEWKKRFKTAFETIKFWYWTYSLWMPESNIWFFVSVQSLRRLIFGCMRSASNSPGTWTFGRSFGTRSDAHCFAISVFGTAFVSWGSSSLPILPVISKRGEEVIWSRCRRVSCQQASLPLQDMWGCSIMGPSSVRLFWLHLCWAVWISPDLPCTLVWQENREPNLLWLSIAFAR